MGDLIAFGLAAFISVFVIVNPLSTIGLFLSLTKNDQPDEKARIAFKTSLVAFCVLVFFALTGFFVFQIYSITLEAFRIAGGIILLAIGMRMLFPQVPQHAQQYSGQIYIVPLGIPMTSGPGAITTVIVLASQATDITLMVTLWCAIFAACAINYIVLRFSRHIQNAIGNEGVSALIKIVGLLVCAVGVQFMVNGLKVAFPILA